MSRILSNDVIEEEADEMSKKSSEKDFENYSDYSNPENKKASGKYLDTDDCMNGPTQDTDNGYLKEPKNANIHPR